MKPLLRILNFLAENPGWHDTFSIREGAHLKWWHASTYSYLAQLKSAGLVESSGPFPRVSNPKILYVLYRFRDPQ